MAFHTKRQRVQNHCVLGMIKQMDLLKFLTKLDIQYYLMNGVIKSLDRIEYLVSEKSGITDSIS